MKLLGIFLFSLASLLFGTHLLRGEKRKCEELEGVYLLLLHMKHAISSEGLPLSEVYASFRNRALEGTPFLLALRKHGLASALAECPPYLPEGSLRSLSLYAEGLGKRFREEENEALARECELLFSELDAHRRALPARLKTRRTLLLSGSGMILLLFI